jgi:hypothetical protein
MYSIEYNDIVMACIFCIVYVGSKLWMYYRIDSKDTKPNKSKRIKSGRKSRVIKRGPEWPE